MDRKVDSMEIFNQESKEQSEDSISRYMSRAERSDDNDINKLDIIHLFGKEKLEDIQKRISKATGLAFVTVDYRGEPITESTFFSRFCQKMRGDVSMELRCKSSDAFGSIQAAVTQKPSVYFCPCGLIEVAIPIVVRGHYLGGFIGGQIRCEDAPDSVSHLEKVMPLPAGFRDPDEEKKLKEEIPVYSYEKFQDIANLVFLIINQLSENEVIKQMQEERLRRKLNRIVADNEKYIRENQKKEAEILELKMNLNSFFLLDTVSTLVNLSLIENAPRTNTLLLLFADYIKYLYRSSTPYVHLADELEQMERYLKIQKEKLGERLAYSIHVPKNLSLQRIPSGILMPFLENAVFLGVMLKQEGGTVELNGYLKDKRVYIEVEDDGPGYSMQELDMRFEWFKDGCEEYFIKAGMESARQRILSLFGEDCGVTEQVQKGKGRKYVICWPEHYDEGVE